MGWLTLLQPENQMTKWRNKWDTVLEKGKNHSRARFWGGPPWVHGPWLPSGAVSLWAPAGGSISLLVCALCPSGPDLGPYSAHTPHSHPPRGSGRDRNGLWDSGQGQEPKRPGWEGPGRRIKTFFLSKKQRDSRGLGPIVCEPKKVTVGTWGEGTLLPQAVPSHLEEARTSSLPGSWSLVGQASWHFSGNGEGPLCVCVAGLKISLTLQFVCAE